MKATDILVEEHRVIERVLDVLEQAAARQAGGQPLSPEFWLAAVDFARGYADGCHHHKEEDVLFTHMQANGLVPDGCPLGVMLAEHVLGRQYIRALTSAAEGMRRGEPHAFEMAVRSSRSYVALLRQHIDKEDNILFHFADSLIPAEQHEQVWVDFDRVQQHEQAAAERYLALAGELERQIAAL